MAYRPQGSCHQNSRMPLVRPMESCPSTRNYAPIMYGSPHNWNVACHQFPVPIPAPSVQTNIPSRSMNSRMISPISNNQPYWQNSNINYDANSPCWPYQQPYNYSNVGSIPVVGAGNAHLDNYSRYPSPSPSPSVIRKTAGAYPPNVAVPTVNKYPDKWKDADSWFPPLNDKTKQENTKIEQHKLDHVNKEKKSPKDSVQQTPNKALDKHENLSVSKDRGTSERYRSRERRHQSRSVDKYKARSRSRDRQSGRYKERDRSRDRKRDHSDHRSYRMCESYRSRSRIKEKSSSKSKECHKIHHSKKHRIESVSTDDESSDDSYDDDIIQDDSLKPESNAWIRSSPAELYYQKNSKDVKITEGTAKLKVLQDRFRHELVERSSRVKSLKVTYEPPPRKICLKLPKPPNAKLIRLPAPALISK
ncbi:ribonuclease 3-like [Centruroides sculpturatus]|uniref:ribonuclease 3-like n=1 Tax=Centruroides sculpturatus TaxID=218467 RepID=UPI000C6DF39D|nr:ribonuclease 3-like [Centruroides sculpturatus]XP_023211651.1 ribonuclease 3-like [Centruroides sculpturatus]XP_023211652.1 ribonuclease 3-like [Centruroides sculpturatus]